MEMINYETCKNYNLKPILKEKGWLAIPLTKHSIYKKGHTYYCTYWAKYYTVLDVEFEQPYNRLKCVTIQWQNGSVKTHCTQLHERDYELVEEDENENQKR